MHANSSSIQQLNYTESGHANLMFCFSDKLELETDLGGWQHENKKKT
jgi:hypothetical protein